MRYSAIIGKLSRSDACAVMPEEYKKFAEKRFRLWTLTSNFSKKDLRELNEIFFNLKQDELLLKLGEYSSLEMANSFLAQAREKASHLTVRKLFLISSKRPALPKSKPFGIRRQSRRRV